MSCYGVEIGPEIRVVDAGGSPEEFDRSLSGNEAVTAQRGEFAHGDAVASHGERLAVIKFKHDLPAIVPQLALADLPAHVPIVAPSATALRRVLNQVGVSVTCLHPDLV